MFGDYTLYGDILLYIQHIFSFPYYIISSNVKNSSKRDRQDFYPKDVKNGSYLF